jgi:signal transduction histidine kinase/CheY-like chemotaxis protein
MARLRLVLSTSGARVWTWNIPRDEVTVVSPAGGPEPPHGSFAAFLALVHPDDREGFQRAVQAAVASGRDYEVEFRVMDGGQPRWLLGRGAVLRDAAGAAASLSGIDVDISERKRGEEERLRLLAQAQDASREAATANRLKDEFLATLSHELRTPLNAITGWAHLLSTGTLDEPTRVRAVDTITRNAHLQHQLISDILDVSRIIAGKLRLELGDADLRAIVDSAVDACGPAAAVRDITVSVASSHPTIPVYADAGRLQQVVSNLLSNAVKFGAAGGRVEVALLASEQDVLLVVQDEGPGIRPDFLPFVFDRFRQADSSSTRPHHGLGLGLAIVRHLLEMHGGTVEAVNRTDRPGAVFRVRLPRRIPREAGAVVTEPPRENAPVDAAPKAAPLEGVRVLIVDDEPDGRELAATVLEHAGAETRVAASAAEAIAVLERERIDVLVTDIEMPGEDGYALLRRIRTLDSPAARMPVAALTAYAGAHDRERVLAAGFQVHVAKPVHPEELTAVVAGLVRAAGRE